MKGILLSIIQCSLLCTALIARAQVLPEQTPQLKPYLATPYFEEIVKEPIRQVTVIVRSDIDRGLKNDTSRIYYYDTMKRRTSEIRFDNNVRTAVYGYTYNGTIRTGWWEEKTARAPGNGFFVTDSFDRKGNRLSSKSYTISKKDTLANTFEYFTYNNNNQLTKRVNKTQGHARYIEDYYFAKSRLIKHNILANPENDKIYTTIVYTYTPAGFVDSIKEFQVRDTNRVLSGWHHYRYDKKQLIKETYNSPSAPSVITNVQYSYYDDGTLHIMQINKDTLYKTVTYTYEHKKVKRISVNTNAWNWLNGEFYIPLSSIGPLTEMPLLYEEQYDYNDHGNVTGKTFLLSGKIVKTMEFSIIYY